MSKSLKVLVTLGVVALVTACGQSGTQEEVVIVENAPISAEPVSGKF
jgi:hypothetical protein